LNACKEEIEELCAKRDLLRKDNIHLKVELHFDLLPLRHHQETAERQKKFGMDLEQRIEGLSKAISDRDFKERSLRVSLEKTNRDVLGLRQSLAESEVL